jgi:hypothetical protein
MQRRLWFAPDGCGVVVYDLDPEHRLAEVFPDTWYVVEQAATYVEALNSLQRLDGTFPSGAAPLLAALAADLDAIADEAGRRYGPLAGAGVARQAAKLREWQPGQGLPLLDLADVDLGELVLICGPLKTFASKTRAPLLSLVVGTIDPERTAAVDKQTGDVESLRRHYVERVGGELQLGGMPRYAVGDLLLCAGEANGLPKHFSHFLPLDLGHEGHHDDEVTVVFENVFVDRYRSVSERVFADVTGSAPSRPLDPRALLHAWFRGHDLGHFWHRPGVPPQDAVTAQGHTGVVLDEALADTLGYLAASGPWGRESADAAAHAYLAELMRYARRTPGRFADSAAAQVELRFYEEAGVFTETTDGLLAVDVDRLQDAAGELVQQLVRCLREGDSDLSRRMMSLRTDRRPGDLLDRVESASSSDDFVYQTSTRSAQAAA